MNVITDDMALELLNKAKANQNPGEAKPEGVVQDVGFSDDPKGN